MKISVTVFVILISTFIVNASVLDPVIENVVHLKASKPPPGVSGIWKKKTIWKPRWVKEWKSAKVMKPIWRKVWSPVQIREWVPIPKPPPGWDSNSTPLSLVHPKPQKSQLKDSHGHDSLQVHSSTKIPLWDPVPYPESQQPPPPPPPPPFPQPLHKAGISCGKGGCDNTPSQTFNHQQILEILGPRYPVPDYPPNPEYSETVNHLTRLPPEGNNWRPPPPPPPPPIPDIRFDNGFNTFQNLPEFLIPPKSPPENDFRFQIPNNKPPTNPPINHLPAFDPQNTLRWTPLPPENKIKGHFITKPPDHPYKFQPPEVVHRNSTNPTNRGVLNDSNNNLKEKPNFQTNNITNGLPHHSNGDFIQEAQLVGEYHYSEFDLPSLKLEPRKPQQSLQEQKIELQQKMETPQKTTQQLPARNEQTRPEVKPPEKPQGTHIQKKHIPNPSTQSNRHFQQQEALIKEIFPIFKPLPTGNYTHHRFPTDNQQKIPTANHTSTKSLPTESNQSNSTTAKPENQQQIKIYPVYETPESIPTNLFPPNHRFSLMSDIRQQEKPIPANQTTTNVPSNHKPESGKPKNPNFDKPNSIQLVFATTPVDYKPSKVDFDKTTTTEPYEVIFSSSLLSTTEAATKSPLVIVTPVSPKL